MEVIQPLSGFLSNHEVLLLLKERKGERDALTKVIRSKEASTIASHSVIKDAEERGEKGKEAKFYADREADGISPQNMSSVEHSTIAYLQSSFLPTNRQSPTQISALLKALEPFPLTKAEKLQIVNLSPSETVELHVIIEEIATRLTETQISSLLSIIASHVSTQVHSQFIDSNGVGASSSAALKTSAMDLDLDEDMLVEAEVLEEEEGLVHEALGGGEDKDGRDIDEVDA